MTTLVRDAVYAAAGLKRLVLFQENWQSCFDVSYEGVVRSFRAAVIAAPIYILASLGLRYMAAELGAPRGSDPVIFQLLDYMRVWLVFPFVAAFAAIFFARRQQFGTWLVVHNWTVLGLFCVQAVVITVYLSGILPLGAAIAFLVGPYHILRLGVHWRVATATLNLSWGAGAAAATLHIVVDLLAITALSYALRAASS
tara:strand:- start:1028 stop:1621 length:594 start_codon:yes stop_codon:yes gene_type:complete